MIFFSAEISFVRSKNTSFLVILPFFISTMSIPYSSTSSSPTGILVQETIPGYQQWFIAFPLADFWIAGCSLLASIFLLRDDERAIPMGISTGSSLIFLGLYALLYGFNTGLLFILTIDEIIEICIKVYCLTVGPYLIISFWQMR